ncbi:MAG: MBL fold metallo-hydrolase [Caldilineaceae bacterium]|nr:MBL fold metallo-hydrolase [Caldilineaceae bacterium]
MQIEPTLYLVGSGRAGFDLTDPFDCNIYLFDSGAGYLLFDAGTGMGTEQILHVCQEHGIDFAQINHLFLTHAHTDHGGGAAHLRERLPLQLYARERTAAIVATGDEAAVSLPLARDGGMYPADYVYRACPVEHVLTDGQVVAIGNLLVETIATPGHSHDHTSYLVTANGKRYLVGGDAIFFGGRVVWQNTYDCSVPATNQSIQKLATYDFDALLTGHLNFSLRDGKRHILAACDVITQMGCPPSIL